MADENPTEIETTESKEENTENDINNTNESSKPNENENKNDNNNNNDNNSEKSDETIKKNNNDNDDESTDYNTDPEYDEQEQHQEHERSNSGAFHERRDSLKKEKEEMQEKLKKLSTIMNVETSQAAFDEMAKIAEDRELFNNIFDKIDPEDNGDVDINEWCAGVRQANIGITESEAIRVFRLMDEASGGGYIDRNEWVTFCMSAFQTKELQQLQYDVLSKIKGHTRKPSNLFHSDNQGNWAAGDMSDLQQEMQQALMGQLQTNNQKAQEEQQFYDEIEKKMNNDPNFGKISRASKWNHEEVAWWLDSIEMGQYSRLFADEQVDGEMLLNDCTRDLLTNSMNIKPLHVGKILREIDLIRKENKEFLASPYMDWNTLDNENKELKKQVEELINKNSVLETENNNLKIEIAFKNNNNSDTEDEAKNNLIGGGLYDGFVMGSKDEVSNDENKDNNNNNNNNNNINKKTKKDKKSTINDLNAEIDRITKEKIDLAINANNEITNLRMICKILSREYNKTMTPRFQLKNPMDMLLGQLGYSKQQ